MGNGVKYSRIKVAQKYFKEINVFSLDRLLEEIRVQEVDKFTNLKNSAGASLIGWFYVANQEGLIAYFATLEEACSYRLSFINRVLNG